MSPVVMSVSSFAQEGREEKEKKKRGRGRSLVDLKQRERGKRKFLRRDDVYLRGRQKKKKGSQHPKEGTGPNCSSRGGGETFCFDAAFSGRKKKRSVPQEKEGGKREREDFDVIVIRLPGGKNERL